MDPLFRGRAADHVPGGHQRVRPGPGGGPQPEQARGESQPLRHNPLLPLVSVGIRHESIVFYMIRKRNYFQKLVLYSISKQEGFAS